MTMRLSPVLRREPARSDEEGKAGPLGRPPLPLSTGRFLLVVADGRLACNRVDAEDGAGDLRMAPSMIASSSVTPCVALWHGDQYLFEEPRRAYARGCGNHDGEATARPPSTAPNLRISNPIWPLGRRAPGVGVGKTGPHRTRTLLNGLAAANPVGPAPLRLHRS
jgi:hypothetical protein